MSRPEMHLFTNDECALDKSAKCNYKDASHSFPYQLVGNDMIVHSAVSYIREIDDDGDACRVEEMTMHFESLVGGKPECASPRLSRYLRHS